MASMRQRRRRFSTTQTTTVTLRLPMATVELLRGIPHSDLMRALRRYVMNQPTKKQAS